MQGQRGAIGSLPDLVDHESPAANVDIDQGISLNNLHNPFERRLSDNRTLASNLNDTIMDGVVLEGQKSSRWSAGESSSSSRQNLGGNGERLVPIGWSPPNNASVGTGLRLNELRFESDNLVSQPIVNLNLSENQFGNRPTFVQDSSSSSTSHNIDLNVGHFDRVDNVMGLLSSLKPSGYENELRASEGSLPPFASSSANGMFLVDKADCQPGCSLDGRRMSCKRKTLEVNAGQSSTGENCFSRPEGSSMWLGIPPHFDETRSMNIATTPENSSNLCITEEVNPSLGSGIGRRVHVDNIHPVNVSGGLESFHRSCRFRINSAVQPDSRSNTSCSEGPICLNRNSDIPSDHHPLRFFPMNPPNLMSHIPSESSVPSNQSVLLRAPTMQRNLQTHRCNSSRPGSSSSSTITGERGCVLSDDSTSRSLPRNIGEHPTFATSVEARSFSAHPTNRSPSRGGNLGISRITESSSHSVSCEGSQSSGGSSRASHRHPTSQFSRGLTEYVRRSLLSNIGSDIAGQISSNNQHRLAPTSAQDGLRLSSGGNQGHNSMHSRSALWGERQGDSGGGTSYLRALAATGEGRHRLISEIRNALDVLRGGEGLQMEDIMILDQSVFFARAAIHDQHRDMRLDVDNMSYEELLALEECIGNVCTGLTDDAIVQFMKQRKYVRTMNNHRTEPEPEPEPEPCCVCQEVYREGEDIGVLDCGHDFHSECIKQWLLQKNLCPICKTTALTPHK